MDDTNTELFNADFHMLSDDIGSEYQQDHDYSALLGLLHSTIEKLKAEGQMELWIQLNEMASKGTFPRAKERFH